MLSGGYSIVIRASFALVFGLVLAAFAAMTYAYVFAYTHPLISYLAAVTSFVLLALPLLRIFGLTVFRGRLLPYYAFVVFGLLGVALVRFVVEALLTSSLSSNF